MQQNRQTCMQRNSQLLRAWEAFQSKDGPKNASIALKYPPNSLTFMCMTWISQKYPSDLKIGEMWLEEGLDVRICTLSAVVKVIIWQKKSEY